MTESAGVGEHSLPFTSRYLDIAELMVRLVTVR